MHPGVARGAVLRPARPPVLAWLLVTPLLPAPARAAEITEVASAFDDDDPYDLNLKVGYVRTLRRAAVKRELEGGAEVELVKDLRYTQVRHTLPLRAEIAVARDFQLHAELPIVLSDTRELEFALNDGGPCIFPEQVGEGELPTCVNALNSTTIRDGLIPGVTRSSMIGRRIAGADVPVAAGQGLHLPDRKGLDQVWLGLDWAVVNQARDDTKPTWVLGFEWRVPVGKVMDYDPADPEGNTAVGRGIHDLVWYTAVSRRFPHVDPFVKFWYALPIASSESLFRNHGGGQDHIRPQQHAGTDFGIEIVPWNPDPGRKFAIQVAAHLQAAFEGRGYSEMWEVFARNPRLRGPCEPPGWSSTPGMGEPTWSHCDVAPGAVDPRTGMPSRLGVIEHPGVTDLDNYATFGGDLAFSVQLSEFARFRLGVGLAHDLGHFITFTDAGEDIRSPADRGPANFPNGRVDPDDLAEVHPLHRPLIDQVGRRYRLEETTVFDFFAAGQLLF